MTEHDLKVAGDIGEMKSDIRTIKHDLVGLQQSNLLLASKIDGISNQQSRGLGFFAGVTFILTSAGAALLAFGKLVLGGIIAGKVHP